MSSRGFDWRSVSTAAGVLLKLAHRRERDVVVHPLLGVEVERLVDPAAEHVAVLGRHAEQRRDHVGRDLGPEVLHVVERALADLLVEQAGAQGADVLFEQLHPPRREGLGDQAPVAGVLRRVHEDHHLDVGRVGRDHLEHGAVRGAERLRVAAEGVDVGEAAHGVEVELLVVIERLPRRAGASRWSAGRPCTSRSAGPRRAARSQTCVVISVVPPRRRRACASQSLMPPRMPAELSTTVMRSRTSPRSRRLTRARCRRRCRGGRRWSAHRDRRSPCAPACSTSCRRSSCAPARRAAR